MAGDSLRRVDLLQPAGALAGAVHSAIDTFRTINDVARSRAGRHFAGAVSWRLLDEHAKPQPAAAQPGQSAEERAWAQAPAQFLGTFVPPLRMVTLPQLAESVARNEASRRRVQEAVAEGQVVGAVGTGVWLLAAAGLLDGLEAPVIWGYQSGFARAFPRVRLASESIVSTGPFMLVAAPSMAHECALHMVAMMGGGDLASSTRDHLVYNAPRQFLMSGLPIDLVSGITRDSPLYRAVTWLTAHAHLPVSIEDAAMQAAVSERQLARLFKQHLNVSPHAYLTDVRMKRAQMWLEVTLRSIEQIAGDCGYADVSAFRRAFKTVHRMPPAEYRRRFCARAPRARWKLDQFVAGEGSS